MQKYGAENGRMEETRRQKLRVVMTCLGTYKKEFQQYLNLHNSCLFVSLSVY